MKISKILLYPTKIPILFLSILVLLAAIGGILGFKRCQRHFVFHEILHPIRDNYQRVPAISYLFKSTPQDLEPYVKELNEHGIVRIQQFLSPTELAAMQQEFAGFVSFIQTQTNNVDDEGAGFTEDYFSQKEQAFCSTNPFKHSQQLINSCCSNKLTSIINHYFKADTYIYRAGGLRILPIAKTGFGSFQWHHDAWGKSVNVMFLLSDVEEGDQYMTYITGSHTIRHSFEKFMHSRLTLEYAQEHMQKKIEESNIFKCTGKAGDIFVFDTNGVHSGNRTSGKARDTFIVSYSTDKSHVWKLKFDEHKVPGALQANNYNPFNRMLECRRNNPDGSIFPEFKSWVDTVINISSWV